MKRCRKVCTKCKKRKAFSSFAPHRHLKYGLQPSCRKCNNQWIKDFYRNNPAQGMLRRAIVRSRIKKLPMNLAVDDLMPLPTHCPIFGFKMTIGNGHQDPHAYSLDRLDNRKGYVRGNVAVMSYLANRLKNDGTAAQHERIAEWMRSLGDKSRSRARQRGSR